MLHTSEKSRENNERGNALKRVQVRKDTLPGRDRNTNEEGGKATTRIHCLLMVQTVPTMGGEDISDGSQTNTNKHQRYSPLPNPLPQTVLHFRPRCPCP